MITERDMQKGKLKTVKSIRDFTIGRVWLTWLADPSVSILSARSSLGQTGTEIRV